jgi:hypothetical protein
MLLAMGVAAGLVLLTLGVLVIYHGLAVGLGRGIETGEYALLPPDREAVIAGVLMTAFGSISISVSLALAIASWKRNGHIEVIASPKEE